MNYENMSFYELRRECVRRGFLDENNKHIKTETKDSVERQERLKRFMEKHNISWDEFFAFCDLAEVDEKVRKKLLREIDGIKN